MSLSTLMLFIPLVAGVFAEPPKAPPAPGTLIDLGGRKLHVIKTGVGSPAVVIENGGGGVSVEWTLVQPEVAKFAEVVAYDRAGYAWSDRAPLYDGIEQTADDLHLMLRTAGIRPPYILVGASLGAIHVRAFRRRFPDEVVGIVLVDGTHDDNVSFMLDGKRRPIGTLSADELKRAYQAFERDAPKPKAGAMDDPPLNKLPLAFQQARHWSFSKTVSEVGLLPSGLVAAESWRQEFTALRNQRLRTPHPLGDLPLIILERTVGSDESWHKQQVELAGLSSAGKLVSVERSGHLIHLDRPDAVINAVREVFDAAKRRGVPPVRDVK